MTSREAMHLKLHNRHCEKEPRSQNKLEIQVKAEQLPRPTLRLISKQEEGSATWWQGWDHLCQGDTLLYIIVVDFMSLKSNSCWNF